MNRLGGLAGGAATWLPRRSREVPMEAQIRLVHWYYTDLRRIACSASGQSNSTKHVRGVTCSACLALLAERRAAIDDGHDGMSDVR